MTGIKHILSCPSSVFIYSNADTQKESILNDNKNRSGIYCWTHIESGKKYVGSSVDLYRRFTQYYNIKYITRASKSSSICRALLKYGYSSFSLDILELCDTSILIQREQYYIDLLKPEYNILQVAGSLFGYKHTQESLEKMREIALNRSDETKAKLREKALGRTYKHSEETKIKLREIMLGKTGHTAQETKQKLKLIQSNRAIHPVKGKSIRVEDTQTNQINIYDSLRHAGKEFNSSHVTIGKYLDKDKLYRNRYIITSVR